MPAQMIAAVTRIRATGDPATCAAIVSGMAEAASNRELELARARLHAHEIANGQRLAAIRARQTEPLPPWAALVIVPCMIWWGLRRVMEVAING